MKLDRLDGIIPSRQACFDLMCLLENEYNCSLKLWLDANNPRGGEIGWRVYCAGSGFVWDHDDLEHFVANALVLDAEGGSLYHAVWTCLRQLESRLKRIANVEVYKIPLDPYGTPPWLEDHIERVNLWDD